MPEPIEDQWREIQQSIFTGRTIQAIKLYREATGEGLKESKDAIDAYTARLRQERPEHFTADAKKGCVGMILMFCGIVATVAMTLG